MTVPAVYKFINWITGTPVPIDDAMTSALTPTVDSALSAALTNFVNALIPAPVAITNLQGMLINGDGIVNNRGSSSIANDTYGGPDRWYNLTQTGACTASQGTAGEAGMPFYNRINQDQAGAQRMGRAQIVENANCNWAASLPVTLSGRIRCSSNQAIRYAILNWTGTADAVTSNVVNDWTSASYTAGGFFLGANLTVVSVGAITPTANTWTDLTALTATLGATVNNLIVFIWTEQTAAQNVTLDFRFKLEQASSATTYYHLDVATANYQCARYYQQTFDGVVATGSLSVGGIAPGVSSCTTPGVFKALMRVTPTMIVYGNGTTASQANKDGNGDITFTSLNGLTSKGFLGLLGAGLFTAGTQYYIKFSADAEL